MKLTAVAAAAAFMITASAAFAQEACPPGTAQCSVTNQSGPSTSNASNDGSTNSQSNPNSNSNVSGNDVSFNPNQQLSQDNNQVSSHANGGNAYGNQSTNNNQSNASSQGGSVNDSGNSHNTVTGTNTQGDQTFTGSNEQSQGQVATGGQGGSASASSSSSSNANASSDAASDQTQGQTMGQGQTADNESTINVDASDRRSSNTEIDASVRYYPPIIPAAPVHLASGNMMVTSSGCGPIVQKTREEVIGVFHGLFGQNKVNLGWDEDIVDTIDPETGDVGYFAKVKLRNGDVKLFGSDVTTTHAIISTGGGRNASLGIFSNKDAGQIGGGGNSSMQRVVLRHTIRACDAGTWKFELPVIEQIRQ